MFSTCVDVHIDLWHPANQEFEFAFVEYHDKILRDKLVEAWHEGVELVFDALRDSMVHYCIDIIRLILLRHRYFTSIRTEGDDNNLSKPLLCSWKSLVKDVCDVIVPET